MSNMGPGHFLYWAGPEKGPSFGCNMIGLKSWVLINYFVKNQMALKFAYILINLGRNIPKWALLFF